MAPTGSFALRAAAAAALLAGSAAAQNGISWGPTCESQTGSWQLTRDICTTSLGSCLGQAILSRSNSGQFSLRLFSKLNCAFVDSTWDMAPREMQDLLRGECGMAVREDGSVRYFRLTPSGCAAAVDDCVSCLKAEMKGTFSACGDAGKDSAKDVLKDNLKSLDEDILRIIAGALAEVTANATSIAKDAAIAGCAECVNAYVDKLKNSECSSCGSLPSIAGELLSSVFDAQLRCTAVLNVKMGTTWTQADVDKAATAPVSCQDAGCDEKVWGNKGDNYRGCQVWSRSGYYCQPWAKAPAPYSGQEQNYCRNLASEQETIWCYVDAKQSNGNFWDLCDPCQAPAPAPPTANGARHLGLATAVVAGSVANVVRLAA